MKRKSICCCLIALKMILRIFAFRRALFRNPHYPKAVLHRSCGSLDGGMLPAHKGQKEFLQAAFSQFLKHPENLVFKPGVVVLVWNPSTPEAEQ